MHVYFVRHGETTLNLQHVHQSPSTPLSPLGREHAVSVAEYLRTVNPERIISSDYVRARETARVIGYHTALTPTVNGLFNEVARPSLLFGQSHYSIRTFWYIAHSVFKRKNPTWRYADGENYTDVSNRAKRALAYLASCAGAYDSVIVVSHAVFTNIMLSYMCDNRMPSLWKLFLTFIDIERMKNTDVIHVEYMPPAHTRTCAWRLIKERERKRVHRIQVEEEEFAV